MLEKMGWKKGEGLGKDGGGMKDPVSVSGFCLEYEEIEVHLQLKTSNCKPWFTLNVSEVLVGGNNLSRTNLRSILLLSVKYFEVFQWFHHFSRK